MPTASPSTSMTPSDNLSSTSESKGNTLSPDKQVVEQESFSESEKKGKTKLRTDDGAVASDLHDDKSDAGIAGAEADAVLATEEQLAIEEKRAIAEE